MIDEQNLTELEKFTVQHPKEICQILTELAKSKALLNISFNHGQDQCLTSVIGVNAEKGVVYLDMGLDDGFNKRLLDATHLIFSKDDGVKVRWTSTKVVLVKLKDGQALKIALPRQLVRLQRREFYRSNTHVVNPAMCRLSYMDPLAPDQLANIDFMLIDASMGGIGVILSAPMPAHMHIDQTFEHCHITIPEYGELTVTLCLRYCIEITTANGAQRHRLGFEFKQLSHGQQRLIQRYVTDLEREALMIASHHA